MYISGTGFCRRCFTGGKTVFSCGFTLIELLVVISIIAVLMSIMTPALTRARQGAQKTVCLSNMRQIGIALRCYLDETGGRLPPSTCHIKDDRWQEYWLYALSRYSGSGVMFRCPADKSRLEFVNWQHAKAMPTDKQRWSSFGYNTQLDILDISGKENLYNKVHNIRHPADCVWISESPQEWTNYDHIHPEAWYNVELAQRQIDYTRHSGKSNYMFIDGSAAWMEIEDTLNWPDRCLWFPQSAPRWPK